MRVLFVHKFWYARGGGERVAMDEARWLSEAGHDVGVVTSAHSLTDRTLSSLWTVPYLELAENANVTTADSVRAATRLFVNREARRVMREALDAFKPDIVHVHTIHRQIEPGVLGEVHRRAIPVVMTLHDAHLVCAADVQRDGDGSVCANGQCVYGGYGACVTKRCKGSVPRSLLTASEAWWHAWRGSWRNVDRIISPSNALRGVVESRGGAIAPIVVVPNAVDITIEATEVGSGFVYAGRVSAEKGVGVFLAAARTAGVSAVIVGDGPDRGALQREYPEATFVGRLDPPAVYEAVRAARALVLPSVCFENQPLAVLEAMASRVAVVASAVGGVPEIVHDGESGLLVPPGEVAALGKALGRLGGDAALAGRLARAGLVLAHAEHSRDAHVQRLVEVYRQTTAEVCAPR